MRRRCEERGLEREARYQGQHVDVDRDVEGRLALAFPANMLHSASLARAI
jgi:hypothetical protein